MVCLSSQAIAQYRSQLASLPEALWALDCIEDCEGDLEDAALTLGIQVGQQPDCTDWLAGLAKRCRAVLCEAPWEAELRQGNLATVVSHLMDSQMCHPRLAPVIVLYVQALGVQAFCEPLHLKLNY
ncbi:hypothetical protein [Synechocystis sp. LKSZ1]|uniref:hypothetical protein n=1 Tax=Synechocystis sp. LKSZ1 TaxID=3144951 RepID=UPI00336BB838